MTTYELPIKDTYVASWGAWEAIREIVQNSLDENDRGNPMKVEHSNGWLSVYNHGSDLDAKALIIGHTDKEGDSRMRGQHGEGLDLAMLAGIRAGLKIQIRTKTEVWNPVIAFSKKYGLNVLKVITSKHQTPKNGVEVRILIDEDQWEQLRRLFIALRDMGDEEIIKTEHGSILLDPSSKGMLYVKGIFTQRRDDLTYGYDLLDVTIDRDRRIIGEWDLRHANARIYSAAIKKTPGFMTKVLTMMHNNEPDTLGVGDYAYLVPKDVKQDIADAFKDKFGKEAVPVKDMKDSEKLEHSGNRGIVVPDSLAKILKEAKVKTIDEVFTEERNKTIAIYSWSELTDDEKNAIRKSSLMINRVSENVTSDLCRSLLLSDAWSVNRIDPMEDVQVVDFFDETLEGQAENGQVKISRKCLKSISRVLRVIIHEKAHTLSLSTVSHAFLMEELWTLIMHLELEGN